jgi:hypothetical protein
MILTQIKCTSDFKFLSRKKRWRIREFFDGDREKMLRYKDNSATQLNSNPIKYFSDADTFISVLFPDFP